MLRKAAELRVDGLAKRRVEHRVEGLDVGPGRRACQDLRGVKLGRTPGDPVQGPIVALAARLGD